MVITLLKEEKTNTCLNIIVNLNKMNSERNMVCFAYDCTIKANHGENKHKKKQYRITKNYWNVNDYCTSLCS